MTHRSVVNRIHPRFAVAVSVAVTLVFVTSTSLALATPSQYPPPPPDAPIVGDVNQDGSVNVIDAMFIAQSTVGMVSLSAAQAFAADTTGDEAVNIIDAMHIAQYTVDPTGGAGILFKPLWEWPDDGGLWDPRGRNSGSS